MTNEVAPNLSLIVLKYVRLFVDTFTNCSSINMNFTGLLFSVSNSGSTHLSCHPVSSLALLCLLHSVFHSIIYRSVLFSSLILRMGAIDSAIPMSRWAVWPAVVITLVIVTIYLFSQSFITSCNWATGSMVAEFLQRVSGVTEASSALMALDIHEIQSLADE